MFDPGFGTMNIKGLREIPHAGPYFFLLQFLFCSSHLLPVAVADVLLSHHDGGVIKQVHYLPDVTGRIRNSPVCGSKWRTKRTCLESKG